jgi:N-acetylneuraminic acid mutarotase
MAVGKVGHLLVVAGGNHYDRARGGYDESTIQSTVNLLDLRQEHVGWQARTPIPGLGRGWCGYATCRDRLYLFGGLTWVGSRSSGLKEALSYDPVADQWTQLTPPPMPIGGWSAGVYRDRYVLLVGGVVWAGVQETDDEPTVSRQRLWSPYVFVYDVEEDRWMRVEGEIVSGRAHGGYINDTGVCLVGDTVYVVGGEGTKGTHTNYLRLGKIEHTV